MCYIKINKKRIRKNRYNFAYTALSVVMVPFSWSANVDVTLPTDVSSVISVVLMASRRLIGTESFVCELIRGSVSQFMPSIHFMDSAPIFLIRPCNRRKQIIKTISIYRPRNYLKFSFFLHQCLPKPTIRGFHLPHPMFQFAHWRVSSILRHWP